VQGSKFYWPVDLATSGLGWLYAEVFTPWLENPSSYAHPQTPIPAGGWVMDAGACEGFFSMQALAQGAKKVLAVEPVPALQGTLRQTFREQRQTGQIDILACALSDHAGWALLESGVDHVWDSSIVATPTAQRPHDRVETVTVDEIVAQHGLEGPGLIKMDIEGAEVEALRGATRTLQTLKPRLAIAVYHSHLNALRCRDVILAANADYTVEFRGMYAWFKPPRPHLLFAW